MSRFLPRRVESLVVLLFLLTLPTLSSFGQGSSYTWRDVAARADGVYVSAGELMWIEKYSKFSKTGYKIWKRPSTALAGAQRTRQMLFFRQLTGSVSACFSPGGGLVVGERRCDGTGSTDNLTIGNGAGAYGGSLFGGTGCSGSSVATFGTDTYSFSTDCLGRDLAPTVTANGADTSVSKTIQTCPIQFGYSAGRTATSCRSSDILVDDVWPVEPGTCTATLDVQMSTSGGQAPRVFHTSDCGCLPDGYFKVTDGAAGATCEIRPASGDPGAAPGADGGVPENDTPGVKTGVPSSVGVDKPYPRPSGGGGGVAGGTSATTGGTGVVSAPGTTPVTIVQGGGGGGLTAGQTTGAVQGALNSKPKDENGNDVAQPTGPTYDTTLPACSGSETTNCVPSEQDWSGLISGWMAANPIVGLFSGSSLTASGACALAGTAFGATVNFNFCPLEPYLALVGTFIVMLTSVYALLVAFGIA